MSVCAFPQCGQPETVAHVHFAASLAGRFAVIYCDEILAICSHPATAHRFADLINRHGLIDVPADAEALTNGNQPDV